MRLHADFNEIRGVRLGSIGTWTSQSKCLFIINEIYKKKTYFYFSFLQCIRFENGPPLAKFIFTHAKLTLDDFFSTTVFNFLNLNNLNNISISQKCRIFKFNYFQTLLIFSKTFSISDDHKMIFRFIRRIFIKIN